MAVSDQTLEELQHLGQLIAALKTQPAKALVPVLASYGRLSTSLLRQPMATRGPAKVQPQFSLDWRSTGHWQVITGWRALAEFLRIQVSTAQVQFSNGQGTVQRLRNHHETGEPDDLTITHTNRRNLAR